MKKLKTPQEISKEVLEYSVLLNYATVEMIKAAQRDALECAKDAIPIVIVSPYVLVNLNSVYSEIKSSILTLMPK